MHMYYWQESVSVASNIYLLEQNDLQELLPMTLWPKLHLENIPIPGILLTRWYLKKKVKMYVISFDHYVCIWSLYM